MFKTGLMALLLLGLGSTAMASDGAASGRVRVFIGVDGYSGNVAYGLSYVGGGRDYGRWDGNPYRGGYYDGRDRRYYSAPRGYYEYRRPYYRPYYGYSRGYYGDRHSYDRRHDRHDGRWDDRRRWHRH